MSTASMPPKSANGSPKSPKSKSSKSGSPPRTGLRASPEEALRTTREDFNQRIQASEAGKKAAEEACNYMRLERDKIHSFWDITKAQVNELQAQLRNKDRAAEEVEDKHQIEIKVYKQKVKHLLYEHQNNVDALKIDAEGAVKRAVEACNTQQAALAEDKALLKQQLREQKAEADEALRRTRMESAKELSKLKVEAGVSAKDLGATFDGKLAALRAEAEARRLAEVQALEDATKAHVQTLVREHNKAYEEMRAYFNDITANTLDLIKALKADAVELQRREAAAEALALELAQENKLLIDPLQTAQKEAAELRLRVTASEDAATRLQASRARLAGADQQIRSLEWKNEVLEQQQEVLESSMATFGLPSVFHPTKTTTSLVRA